MLQWTTSTVITLEECDRLSTEFFSESSFFPIPYVGDIHVCFLDPNGLQGNCVVGNHYELFLE